MMNTHLLEIPLSRTYFHGPEGVQAIEVLLHIKALEEQKVLSFIVQGSKSEGTNGVPYSNGEQCFAVYTCI